MATPNTPDPYNNFKDDDQRRRALNVQAICKAVGAVFNSMMGAIKAISTGIGAIVGAYLVTNADVPKVALVWLQHALR